MNFAARRADGPVPLAPAQVAVASAARKAAVEKADAAETADAVKIAMIAAAIAGRAVATVAKAAISTWRSNDAITRKFGCGRHFRPSRFAGEVAS